MDDVLTTTRLFSACRVLFGPQVEITLEFLNYLQESGVKDAYRRRARETHPDRAAILNCDARYLESQFRRVHDAYRCVMSYVENPHRLKLRGTVPHRQERPHRHYRTPPFTSPTTGKLPFGRFLYHRGLISYHQLIDALVWQKASRPKFGELAKGMQFLVDPEILTILRERKDGERFGDTAYRLGLLTRHEIERLANYQRLIQPRIGKYFVERGILTLLEIERLAWESKYLRERTPTTPGFRTRYSW